jgi:hypothetical protein
LLKVHKVAIVLLMGGMVGSRGGVPNCLQATLNTAGLDFVEQECRGAVRAKSRACAA